MTRKITLDIINTNEYWYENNPIYYSLRFKKPYTFTVEDNYDEDTLGGCGIELGSVELSEVPPKPDCVNYGDIKEGDPIIMIR